MRQLEFGTGFAIFVMFFALSLFEAFRSGRWAMVVLWLATGIAFFIADNLRARDKPHRH